MLVMGLRSYSRACAMYVILIYEVLYTSYLSIQLYIIET